MQVFLFLATAIALMMAGHYLLYFTTIRFFNLNQQRKKYLAVVLGLLSLGFVISMPISRWVENVLTKGVFYLASLWLGVFAYIFFAVVIFWLIYAIAQYLKLCYNWRLILISLVGLSLLVSIWGIYSAYHPVIHQKAITIKNLPVQWQGKKIMHLSDLHLGLSNGPGFLRHVVELIKQKNPDIILITGDLFDGGDGDLTIFLKGLNQLEAPLGVYHVTGNHENYLGIDEVNNILRQTKIKTLSDETVEIDGLRLVGINHRGGDGNLELLREMKALSDDSRAQILMFHSPSHLKDFSSTGYDLMLSGHTHRGQVYPFGFITHWVYKGYDRGLSQIGDMQLYVSSGTGTWGPPMKTSGRTEIVIFNLQ